MTLYTFVVMTGSITCVALLAALGLHLAPRRSIKLDLPAAEQHEKVRQAA